MKPLVIYRISDKSYRKSKLPGATKKACLVNFITCFHNWDLKIIADNCKPETVYMVEETVPVATVEVSNFGNAGSLYHAITMALELENLKDDQVLYFVEDDYIHDTNKDCEKLILEGLEETDYVTLYDHPDKYEFEYGYGEIVKVFKTESSHWKWTQSTTMTFATTVRTLRQDSETWLKYTSEDHPHDHHIFTELGHGKLSHPIPGASCHVDLTYSEEKNCFLMDDFAIDYLTNEMLCEIALKDDLKLGSISDPLKRLAAIYTLLNIEKKTPS